VKQPGSIEALSSNLTSEKGACAWGFLLLADSTSLWPPFLADLRFWLTSTPCCRPPLLASATFIILYPLHAYSINEKSVKPQTVTVTMHDHKAISSICRTVTFFSLPIELCIMIYFLVFNSSHSIKIYSVLGKYLWDREGRRRRASSC